MTALYLKRILGVTAIAAGLTWGVLFGLAVNGWENDATRQARTAAFVVMIAAGSLYPVSRPGGRDDDETL